MAPASWAGQLRALPSPSHLQVGPLCNKVSPPTNKATHTRQQTQPASHTGTDTLRSCETHGMGSKYA
jgi:hypothetical protein